jgi:RNA polymerase sigma factor (sigma-70 family)
MRDVTLPAEVPIAALDFESFFRLEYPKLAKALVLLVGDAFEAEELAQETMTRLLERWDRVASMDSPVGYAYRTAMNLQRKRIRRLAVRAKRRFASAPVDDIAHAVGDREDVHRALASLPQAQRAALVLVDWLDLDTGEAADALGITAGNLRVRLHRARASLRDTLGATS